MRIAEVIGKVTLSKWHPSLEGAAWKLGVVLSQSDIKRKKSGKGEWLVIYDELGAGEKDRIAVSDGAEASAPFYPDQKPIDAYNAAILDVIEVE